MDCAEHAGQVRQAYGQLQQARKVQGDDAAGRAAALCQQAQHAGLHIVLKTYLKDRCLVSDRHSCVQLDWQTSKSKSPLITCILTQGAHQIVSLTGKVWFLRFFSRPP